MWGLESHTTKMIILQYLCFHITRETFLSSFTTNGYVAGKFLVKEQFIETFFSIYLVELFETEYRT